MKTAVLLFSVSLLLVQWCDGEIWKYCSDSDKDPVKINSLSISPDPPKKGEEVKVNADISILNGTTITNGTIYITAELYKVPFFTNKTWELCPQAERVNIKCPIKSGELKLSADPTITDLAPPGNYSIQAIIADQDDKRLLCIEADFKL